MSIVTLFKLYSIPSETLFPSSAEKKALQRPGNTCGLPPPTVKLMAPEMDVWHKDQQSIVWTVNKIVAWYTMINKANETFSLNNSIIKNLIFQVETSTGCWSWKVVT